MRKLIFFLFALFLYADIYNNKNISVLNALDVDDTFIRNAKLQSFYKSYLLKRREYFLNVLENGYKYVPLIKDAILKSDVPHELLSVAIAESYLSSFVKSHKKAMGLWQFMPATAKRFGLKIDEYVDERKDPIKSTKAAIRYLEYLHKFFGKWYLAIVAYNAGEARVVEAVVRVKVDKLCEKLGEKCKENIKIKRYRQIIKNYQRKGKYAFNDLYILYKNLNNLNYLEIKLNDLLKFQKGLKRQYLPRETRDYILKVIAMSFLFNSDDFINYANTYLLNSGVLSELQRVYVPRGTSLYYVSDILGVSYKKLRRDNMHLNYAFTPPYRYYIYIPYNKLALFKSKFKPKSFFIVYTVKKGDTLIKIARKFGTKVNIIKDYNKIGKYLQISQKLTIPLHYKYIEYKVKQGDTLSKIAKKFGAKLEKIKKINNLNSNLLRAGQTLKIPKRY
ncbi:MAG TPA: LysM peptidoglycan-binding domain-containing protein [Nautiliaceae bacterium]|nr:LysM peptidoglycan-binding domain-containing protein [Nautiliaceae bacterium]